MHAHKIRKKHKIKIDIIAKNESEDLCMRKIIMVHYVFLNSDTDAACIGRMRQNLN